ncbi:MAG: carbon storage regulator CsrA [Gemmataceae bacterium]
MLVLTRKVGETIVIGDTIRLTVVQIANGRVKLGIEAPTNVPVFREEVYERKVSEATPAPIVVNDPTMTSTSISTGLHNRIADHTSSVDPRKPR